MSLTANGSMELSDGTIVSWNIGDADWMKLSFSNSGFAANSIDVAKLQTLFADIQNGKRIDQRLNPKG